MILFICLIASACTPAPDMDGTAAMVARLDSVAAWHEANPRANAHVNKARVAALEQVTPPLDLRSYLQYRATLGEEYLRAGYNDEAIATFAAILDSLAAHRELFAADYELAVRDYLAISYLRKGELDNCLTNPSIDRCLLPISGDGVHTERAGSERAIEQYERLLAADPADLNSRWLLNIAHMTLGQFPAQVPAEHQLPPTIFTSEADFPRFRDISQGLGLDVMGLSGGVSMEDFTGDGHLDLLMSSWGLRDPLHFFVSGGDGTFHDQTEAAGLAGITGGLNMVHADYDNDGDADVLILRGAWLAQGVPNSLLRNNGDGTFSDVTEAAGLLSFHPTHSAAWADYDGDGWLDVFVGNESNRQAGPHPSALYRNNGDGTFTDIARDVGLDVLAYTKGVVWGDINNDQRPDLFLTNYQGPNLLFRNDGPGEDGGWRFTEVAAEAGVQEPIDSFPAWFWDVDNDGHLDLFVSGWRANVGDLAAELLGMPRQDEPPRLYRNNGDGTFTDIAEAAGLNRVLYTMGTNFGDLDNDGWLDFYAGTGDPDFRALMPNRMFRNVDGTRFEEVTTSGGFGHVQKGHGVAFGDLDHDGDQDIYTVMGGAFEGDVFHNVLFDNPGFGHRWLTLRLEGTASNRAALGAQIRVDVVTPEGERSIYRTVGTGGSFGASSLQQEIGLGDATAVAFIEVTWPSGRVQRFDGLALDAVYRLREGEQEAVRE